jgi:LPXTG-motif cell wall-anchored protein
MCANTPLFPAAGCVCCGAAGGLWLTRRKKKKKGFGSKKDKWEDPVETPVSNGSSAVAAKL